jgi:hypothetical protein
MDMPTHLNIGQSKQEPETNTKHTETGTLLLCIINMGHEFRAALKSEPVKEMRNLPYLLPKSFSSERVGFLPTLAKEGRGRGGKNPTQNVNIQFSLLFFLFCGLLTNYIS